MPSAFQKLKVTLVTALGGVMPHTTLDVTMALQDGVTFSAGITAATKAVVVYGTQNATVRRVIIPDHDDDISTHQPPLNTGEASIKLLITSGLDIATVNADVSAATGKVVSSGRAALVDQTNTVVNLVMADPALDTHPAGILVLSDLAAIGDIYKSSNGTFLRLWATVDSSTNKVVSIGLQTVGDLQVAKGFYLFNPTGLKVGDVVPTASVAAPPP